MIIILFSFNRFIKCFIITNIQSGCSILIWDRVVWVVEKKFGGLSLLCNLQGMSYNCWLHCLVSCDCVGVVVRAPWIAINAKSISEYRQVITQLIVCHHFSFPRTQVLL